MYGATKKEVSEKLLDLRVEMKDADFIKEKGMPLIQIMELIRDKKYNSNKIKDGQYSRITKTTRCIESGVNAVVLQRLLGHTDISITLNTYTSVFNLFKDNELEKVIELYKNNSLGLVQEENIENFPIGNSKLNNEKNNSLSMVPEWYTEKFQNGTEEIYPNEEDDEMDF